MAKNKNHKGKMRSALTGKIINGGSEVVKVDEAIEYVKKQGFQVRPLAPILIKSGFAIMGLLFCVSFILIPRVSALSPLLTYDFSQQGNQVILGVFLILAGVLYYTERFKVYSGFMVLAMGMIMALNNINLLISLLIMGIGLMIISGAKT